MNNGVFNFFWWGTQLFLVILKLIGVQPVASYEWVYILIPLWITLGMLVIMLSFLGIVVFLKE